MAMPVATGIEAMTSKPDKATMTPGSPRREACPNRSIQTSVPAEADHQRDHGAEPGQQQHRAPESQHPVQHRRAPFFDLSRVAPELQQRRAPFGPEYDGGQDADQADGEATEPGYCPPAACRRVAVREQQGQEHQDYAEPW